MQHLERPIHKPLKKGQRCFEDLFLTTGVLSTFSTMAPPSLSVSRFFPRPRLQWSLFLLIAIICLRTARAAARTGIDVPFETLLVDNSVPILVDGKWEWVAEDAPELRRRQNNDDEEADDDDDDRRGTPTPSPTRTRDDDEAASTVTVKPKTTDEDGEEHLESITSTTTTSTKAPLPSAFDNSLDFNFTSNGGKSCPKFLNNLLTSDTFKSCYPISMMLQVGPHFPPFPYSPTPLTPRTPIDLQILLRRHKRAPINRNRPRRNLRR